MYSKSIEQSHLENMILLLVCLLWQMTLKSQLKEQKIVDSVFLIQKSDYYLFSII